MYFVGDCVVGSSGNELRSPQPKEETKLCSGYDDAEEYSMHARRSFRDKVTESIRILLGERGYRK